MKERDIIEMESEDGAGRRHEVLQVLKAARAPMQIRTIADKLGVHPNTVRFHLDVLTDDGRVERVAAERGRAGRPPLLFRAVQQMDRGGTRRYRLLAEILTTGIAAGKNPRARALAAGRAWGRQLTKGKGTRPGGSGASDKRIGICSCRPAVCSVSVS